MQIFQPKQLADNMGEYKTNMKQWEIMPEIAARYQYGAK
jgi:hypothetical protein